MIDALACWTGRSGHVGVPTTLQSAAGQTAPGRLAGRACHQPTARLLRQRDRNNEPGRRPKTGELTRRKPLTARSVVWDRKLVPSWKGSAGQESWPLRSAQVAPSRSLTASLSERRRVAEGPALVTPGLWESTRLDREDVPLLGHAFKGVDSPILETDARARHEILPGR